MTRPNVRRALLALTITAFTVPSVGCGINRRYANGQIHRLPHTDIAVEYVCGQRATTGIQTADTSDAPSGRQVLSIVYPHPSPKYGRKYAEVVLQTEPDVNDAAVSNAISQLVANPFKKDAAAEEVNGNSLRLTITREELEFLLRDLVADSYFDREERNGDVQLSVTLGSRSIQKPWDRVASFDQLAQRVRQEYGNRPGRSGAGKAVTAHAELLPPAASDLMAEAPPESARSGKFHATPQF